MRRRHLWPALPTGRLGELGTTQAAGQLSAVLFLLCGLLVALTSPLMPSGPGVRHVALVGVGLVAAAAGIAMGAMPWHRWPRRATLWLVPAAFLLIAVHNWASGANGLRYTVFFFVVAAWVGLMHPKGTTLAVTPGMVGAYLLPSVWLGQFDAIATSLTYAVPVFVLVGECASLVAERVRSSEADLRRSEQRFRALVQNASDAISVLAADGTILWESPGITAVLGYEPDERVGTNGLNYLVDESAAEVAEVLAEVVADPGATRRLELQVLHKNGGLRWCEVTGRNLLHEPAVAGLVVNISDVTERHRAQELQAELAAIVSSSPDAVIGLDVDGTVRSANSAAAAMYGWTRDDLVGRNVRDFVLPERAAEVDDNVRQVLTGMSLGRIVTKHVRSDGEVIDVALSVSPVRDPSGEIVSVAAIIRDITAEIRARDTLADTAASFRLLFFANPQPMWVYDAETLQFLEVNESAIRHYGYSREQFLAMTIVDIRPDDEVPRLLEHLVPDRDDLATDGWHHRLADGRVIDVDVTAHRLTFNGREAVLVAAVDTTDRIALEMQLRHQAFHDSLTGLSNRALFQDRVEHAINRREQGAGPVVLLLDLDQFKVINDSQGHAMGDELLVAVARRLEGAVRSGDTVARLGGDEFAVLLDRCPPELAERQADRLLTALATPLHIGGAQVVATGSIGIAAAEPGLSSGELLRNADMAMYRAKASGGGCFRLFEPGMHADAL
jgi:diguanylate cyclase (GGDEF)-like protein/PAS domain S-box-containing protein